MASSTEELHHLPSPCAATTAPLPTPSTHPNISSTTATSDALANLLHRLPPTLSLSLPTRRSSAASTPPPPPPPPPPVSLSDPIPTLQTTLLSASTKIGFFNLIHQPISAADSAALSIFNLPSHRKQQLFPNGWPLGYNEDDDHGESFCLDYSSFTESRNDLDLDSLREFTLQMEGLGLRLIQELASAIGFSNPTRDELCSLLWMSDNGMNKPGRTYPYVVGLHYIPKSRKWSLCSDSGWVNVLVQDNYVLVIIRGEIG